MLRLNQDICDYAQSMIDDCRLKSAEIFICDKVSTEARISSLYSSGLRDEICDRYQQARLFEVDPFADETLKEQVGPEDDSLILGNDPRITQLDARAEEYWRFVSEHRIGVFGAANRQLAPRLYLIIGTHHHVKGSGWQDVAVERLQRRMRVLQDMVSGQLLRALCNDGMGYPAFCRALGHPHSQPVLESPNPLTLREQDIARLVSEGRQNKEIAYQIDISEHTVENHLRRIYRKLGIHNRAALAARMSGATQLAA